MRRESRNKPRRFTGAAAGFAVGLLTTVTACGGDREIDKPDPLFSESPVEYPLDLWHQDVEGSTVVRVLVNEEGGVDSVMIAETSGHVALDSAAVRGARAMVFTPARKEGKPLRVWARVPVYFSKDGKPPPTLGPRSTGGG